MVNFKYKQNKYKIQPIMWERKKIRVTPIANLPILILHYFVNLLILLFIVGLLPSK